MDCGKLLYEQIVEDITERIRVGTLAVGDAEPIATGCRRAVAARIGALALLTAPVRLREST